MVKKLYGFIVWKSMDNDIVYFSFCKLLLSIESKDLKLVLFIIKWS